MVLPLAAAAVIASPLDEALVAAAVGAGARPALIRRQHGDPVAARYAAVPGYRPLPSGAGDWNQIGVWGDQYLSQFPAYWPGPQLRTGVEFINTGWMTPQRSANVGDMYRNQRRAYQQGPQLMAQPGAAPLGPLTANAVYARVTAAQVRQSGLSALAWASQLTEG